MSQEKRKKIYELKCPGNETYVGQTHKSLNDRWRRGTAYRPNSKVGKAILKYGWDNIEKTVLYENLSQEEADRIEKEEIEKRGGINHPLVLNANSGGHSGYDLSEEFKEKMSKGMKNFYEEHPEVAKEKVVSSRKYYYENNLDAVVQVDQYSYDGTTLIASYESTIAAHRATGVGRSSIAKCLTGEYSEAGGYRWVPRGKKPAIIQYSTRANNVLVNQIDVNTGKVVATYHSISRAAVAMGVDKRVVSGCVNHGRPSTINGYKFEKSQY